MNYCRYYSFFIRIDPDLQYVVLCTMIRRQKENCGEAAAVNDVSSRVRSSSFKFLCQWKVFNESVNCATDQGTYGE